MVGNGSGSRSWRAERLQELVAQRPEDARVEQRREQHRERDQRPERRVDAVSPSARLITKTITPEIADSAASTRIDASTVGVSVTSALPPQRQGARGRRPDAARDVLREHRDHLGLQRDAVGHRDSPGVEDAHPAEDEHEVVDGHRHEREHDVADARVLQERPRVAPTGCAPPRCRSRASRRAARAAVP